MSNNDQLEMVEGGVKQLLSVTVESISELEDTNKQLTVMSTAVHNFVMQTMQQVSDNTDVAAVNQLLANSLLQVKDFIQNRPLAINQSRQHLLAKKDAFEQVLLLVNETKELQDVKEESPNVVPAQYDLREPEELEKPVSPEKKRQILEDFGEDGKYKKKYRKIGERPERLRTIRKLEEELAAQKNLEEDN